RWRTERLARNGPIVFTLARQLAPRFVEPPLLRPGELQHERVVRVEMRGEPLRAFGRDVGVDSGAEVKEAFDSAAKACGGLPVLVQEVQNYGVALGIRVVETVHVTGAFVTHVRAVQRSIGAGLGDLQLRILQLVKGDE